MSKGCPDNRRQPRSQTRKRAKLASIPPKTNTRDQPCGNQDNEVASSSCQLCSSAGFCGRSGASAPRSASTSGRADDTQGGVMFGPWPRPQARSRSAEPCSTGGLSKPQCMRRALSDIPRLVETSESSSSVQPLSSPTLSGDSSTLLSESVADLFPFDSEIFAISPKLTEVAEENLNDGVVALRNPNTVALCPPPKMITDMPPKIGLGIPSMRGTFGTVIPPTPPIDVRDMMETLKSITANSQAPAAVVALQGVGVPTQNITAALPSPRKPLKTTQAVQPRPVSKPSTSNTRPTIPAGPHKKKTVVSRKTAPVHEEHPHEYGNILEYSPLGATSWSEGQEMRVGSSDVFRLTEDMPSASKFWLTVPTIEMEGLTSDVLDTAKRIAEHVEWADQSIKQMMAVAASSLKFCCQLAHGSPTAIISNFSSVEELFQSIADCFNISPDDIIFCTINTFKIDMEKLFSGTLEYSDMLFAHVKGQAVELEMTKTEALFGLTVSDNGRCRSFIKRMKEGSVAAQAQPALAIGQLIEKIDGVNVTGMRHYEVVRILRNMPIGKTFTIRVVSPKQSGFQQVAQRSLMSHRKSLKDGLRTLRFKANGGVVIEQGVVDKVMIGKLNEVLDSYLGVQDDQMAQTLWDIALKCETLPEMTKAVRQSELSVFDFPDELVFDMWGVIGDYRRSLAKKKKEETKTKGQVNLLSDDEEQPLLPLF